MSHEIWYIISVEVGEGETILGDRRVSISLWFPCSRNRSFSLFALTEHETEILFCSHTSNIYVSTKQKKGGHTRITTYCNAKQHLQVPNFHTVPNASIHCCLTLKEIKDCTVLMCFELASLLFEELYVQKFHNVNFNLIHRDLGHR